MLYLMPSVHITSYFYVNRFFRRDMVFYFVMALQIYLFIFAAFNKMSPYLWLLHTMMQLERNECKCNRCLFSQ